MEHHLSFVTKRTEQAIFTLEDPLRYSNNDGQHSKLRIQRIMLLLCNKSHTPPNGLHQNLHAKFPPKFPLAKWLCFAIMSLSAYRP